MKRILTVSLAALLLILSVQPVAAASGFSLYQGEISGNYLGNALLGEIFKNMRIDAVFLKRIKRIDYQEQPRLNRPSTKFRTVRMGHL